MNRFPLFLVIIAAAFIAAVVLFLERRELPKPSKTGQTESAGRQAVTREDRTKAAPKRQTREEAGPATGNQGRQIAVIIDDIGFDLGIVRELAAIRAPIAFAVLPHTPHGAEAAEILHKAGKEILLHLPMEPHSYPDSLPGAGALMVDMDEKSILNRLRENLASVPYVSGVNNHMGSRFMEDGFRLGVVMKELGRQGLYFVDSRTTPESRGREAAYGSGVRFAERNIFIDHLPGYAAAVKSLTDRPFREGEKGKPLLMIGHPHPDTVRAVRDTLPRLNEEGVRLTALRAFMETYMETNRNAPATGGRLSGKTEVKR